MLIKINKDYQIETDPLSATLKKATKPKPGNEPGWSAVGYFPNLEQAIERLIDDRILTSKASEAWILLDEICQTKRDILAAISEATN